MILLARAFSHSFSNRRLKNDSKTFEHLELSLSFTNDIFSNISKMDLNTVLEFDRPNEGPNKTEMHNILDKKTTALFKNVVRLV